MRTSLFSVAFMFAATLGAVSIQEAQKAPVPPAGGKVVTAASTVSDPGKVVWRVYSADGKLVAVYFKPSGAAYVPPAPLTKEQILQRDQRHVEAEEILSRVEIKDRELERLAQIQAEKDRIERERQEMLAAIRDSHRRR